MAADTYHLAIAELVIYIIAIIPNLFVLYRHGRRGLSAWFWLTVFFFLQVIAQGLVVGVGEHGVSSTGLIISQVGLSPLLMATDGILREIASETELRSTFLFGWVRGLLFHAVVTGAAALIGIGAGSLYSTNPSAHAQSEVRGGVIVLLFCWAFLVWLTLVEVFRFREIKLLRLLLWSSVFALPWLFLRVLYSILAFFVTSTSTFSPLHGNFTVKVIMQALPTLVVSIFFVSSGVLTIKCVKDLQKLDQLRLDHQSAIEV